MKNAEAGMQSMKGAGFNSQQYKDDRKAKRSRENCVPVPSASAFLLLWLGISGESMVWIFALTHLSLSRDSYSFPGELPGCPSCAQFVLNYEIIFVPVEAIVSIVVT